MEGFCCCVCNQNRPSASRSGEWSCTDTILIQRCIYTYVYVYGDPLVLLTSSGIFSSHFHWHKSLLYINQFKLLNQKYIKVQCQAKKKKEKKKDAEENVTELIRGYIKDTNGHDMGLP